jgi:AcrR family transcriptional regulator
MSKLRKPAAAKSAPQKTMGSRTRRPPPVTVPEPYHHGDLRRVLIDAALQIVAESGADAVSVREAARRAGVSPGAPFRHFPTRTALMAAVAAEAQRLFEQALQVHLSVVPDSDPLARFRAFGLAYLSWAMRHPAYFAVISDGRYFDHDRSALKPGNDAIIAMTDRLLSEAYDAGQLRSGNLRAIKLAGRALVYGFARMKIDGHFPRWGIADGEADDVAAGIIDVFIDGISGSSARLS